MFLKEMYTAKRCFKERGGKNSEIVSVGYSCMPIRCICGVFPNGFDEWSVPPIGFESLAMEQDVALPWIVCNDIPRVVALAKEALNDDEQILYYELYGGNGAGASAIYDCDFEFCGYDLIEAGASAIYDCDFEIDNINEFGLIATLDGAIAIDRQLRAEFPDESHAHCDIYGVWRYVKRGKEGNGVQAEQL
jgi:hypothetical protein